MKLDATDLRYISSEEFRVLTAVEMGSKNHEVVPTPLIVQISGLRNGGVHKLIGSLAKRNLVSKVQNSSYDGYRLTYGGYDYLAIRTLLKRDTLFSIGNQIGVGKESDIYVVADSEGTQMVLKIHRLGRTSFRAIKSKRDYMGNRKSASWMYMSRLAAQKEWAFMKVLYENGFPVPKPIDQARHCIIMELIDAFPLRQISSVPSPGKLYSSLMDLVVRLASAGLIHGDFNEFNILIREGSSQPIMIDFPQMVSTRHPNAEEYFNRDVECIRTFFKRRFGYESQLFPKFSSTVKDVTEGGIKSEEDFRLDVMVAKNGFKSKDMKTLEEYMKIANSSENPENDDLETSDEEQDEGPGEGVESDFSSGDVEASENSEDNKDDTNQAKGQDNSESPPPFQRSSCPSPSLTDLAEQTKSLNLDDPLQEPTKASVQDVALAQELVLKSIVSSESRRQAEKQKAKYHSKKGGGGRWRGSKAKQGSGVKLDGRDGWD